ncbi:17746_t:CDS:1, partial [Gigaspora margarita]
STTTSQINNIWYNTDLILELNLLLVNDTTYITSSDHAILSTIWHVEIRKTVPMSRNKKYKCKVYQYEKMDEKS